ncbi:MAG: hypothetical protein ABI761_08805 [Saprospiraceae bacterium]
MKLVIIFSLLFSVLSSELSSQARAFRDFVVAASSNTNPELLASGFQAFGGSERFVGDEWIQGGIISTKGEFISDKYKFNYDFNTNEVYVKHDEDQQTVVLQNNTIRNFFLIDPKTRDSIKFIKFIAIDPRNKQFYQLLAGDMYGKAALLKFKTVEIVKANKNSYANNFNGTYKDTYTPHIDYYLVTKEKGAIKLDKLIRKSFTDEFPELREQANAVVKKPNLNESQAIVLTNFLNLN